MNLIQIRQRLADERCGLFFLAGLDESSSDQPAALTIHVAEGAICSDHAEFIDAQIKMCEPGVEVRFKSHSASELYAPDCLENFVRTFRHDHIVADPTGAFTRAPDLLKVAQELRSVFGTRLSNILWNTREAVLVCVTSRDAMEPAPSGELQVPDSVREEFMAVLSRLSGPFLSKLGSTAQIVATTPAGRYVPVDQPSVPLRSPTPQKSSLITRIARFAAIVGLGTMSATAAAASTDQAKPNLPAITALAGLTTLGENSFGLRNPYQAVGGLRLYLGEAGVVLFASLGDSSSANIDHLLQKDSEGKTRPVRIAYD